MKFRFFCAVPALLFGAAAAAQSPDAPQRPDETYGESQKGIFGDPSRGRFGNPESGYFGNSRYRPPSRMQAPGARAGPLAPLTEPLDEAPPQASEEEKSAPAQ